MMCTVDRFNPIFEGIVPITVEHTSRENESLYLTVRILTGHVTNAQGSKQEILHMEITHDEDTFFLYTLEVSEEDFHDLKNDQCLLVDFKSFPKSFVELLTACIESKSPNSTEKNPAQSQLLRFTAILSLHDRPVLKIVEANQFKNLTHLALRFQPGTDQTIKSYLAGRLHKTSIESEKRWRELKQALQELKEKSSELQRVKTELEALTCSSSQTTNELTLSHKHELETALAKQKEESLKLLQQSQQAASEQALKQQAQANERIADLESRLKLMTEEKNKLDTISTKLMAENQTLSTRLEVSDKSSDVNNAEMERLRERNRDLEKKLFEYEKLCTANEMSISSLKQQLLDKEDILSKTTALLESGNERKSAAEEKLQLYKQSTQKLQRKLESTIAEINKGNTIIEKQQSEYRQVRAKLKTKSVVIRQQEKVVNDLKTKIDQDDREIYRLKQLVNTEKETVKQLKISLEASQKKLEECNNMLESNQNVISYLNKEINQAQMVAAPRLDNVGYNNTTPLHQATTTTPTFAARSPVDIDLALGGNFADHLASYGFESLPNPDLFDNEVGGVSNTDVTQTAAVR